ncbi:ABC transporter permease [Klebsiella sp. 2680]|uniref:ABC transporter permease n=1 Tax=Klebsiella sp. 2680 TaxID=2018037 RepID=UPI001157CD37|nr:ABC transporter permease [Klebsiella sp. 2680]
MKISSQSTLIPTGREKYWLAILLCPTVTFLLVMLILPFTGLVKLSLVSNTSDSVHQAITGVFFSNLFSDSYFMSVVFETLIMGVAVALICAVIGFPVGYSLARLPVEKRRWKLIAVVLPLTLSLVVVVFGWLVVLGSSGIINKTLMTLGIIDIPLQMIFNPGSVTFVLVQQFLPFMILSVMGVVSQIDHVLEEASANLGANRLTTFRRVILPMAAPGIATGMLLVFILTISAFITPRLIGGSRVQMIGAVIYEKIVVLFDWSSGAAMSIMLLIITVIFLISLNIVKMMFARRS